MIGEHFGRVIFADEELSSIEQATQKLAPKGIRYLINRVISSVLVSQRLESTIRENFCTLENRVQRE